LKNASKIDEFATQFDHYNLKLENQVRGFDPQQYFMNHMVFIGFSVSYINSCIYGEEENDDNNSEEVLVANPETIINTNESHHQHGGLSMNGIQCLKFILREVTHSSRIPKLFCKKNKNL
jgi:hypothetical protein